MEAQGLEIAGNQSPEEDTRGQSGWGQMSEEEK